MTASTTVSFLDREQLDAVDVKLLDAVDLVGEVRRAVLGRTNDETDAPVSYADIGELLLWCRDMASSCAHILDDLRMIDGSWYDLQSIRREGTNPNVPQYTPYGQPNYAGDRRSALYRGVTA